MSKEEKVNLRISGMTCEDCAVKIESKLKQKMEFSQPKWTSILNLQN